MIKSNKNKAKKGQITIFIIIALIIVVSIALIFVLIRKPGISISPEYDPQAYIEKCTADVADEAISILMPHGSYIEPTNFKLYQNEKIGYLCYNQNYYYTCINQEPMLIEHIEEEITEYIKPRIQNCFVSLRKELEDRAYQVDIKNMTITTELQTRKVVITINREIGLTKNQETRKFSKFKAQIISPVYDLAKISLKIINGEASNCGYDYVNHAMLYPLYDIKKFTLGDSVKIYTLTEKVSGKTFKFAVRSCVIPPGF